jgi:hypothetical protein
MARGAISLGKSAVTIGQAPPEIEQFTHIIQKDPMNPELFLQRAAAYMTANYFEGAIEYAHHTSH